MISAKLIKSLERRGFFLELPEYNSNDELIMDILKQNNPRLNYSLPTLLNEPFDYKKIILKLTKEEKTEFNKAILISNKIYRKEKIENSLGKAIQDNKITVKFSPEEFRNYAEAFAESQLKKNQQGQKIIEKQSKLRINLDLNKGLQVLFSPAKIKIMEKIYNHEKLTNSELKYYYRAISNINKSVLNPALQDYLRVVEMTKKETGAD